MVKKEAGVYLLIGTDSVSKDANIRKIKQELLGNTSVNFNFDAFHQRDLSLKDLQERILSLPLKSKKRVILIKEAQDLKDQIKEFILNYAKNPHSSIVLILDSDESEYKNDFIKALSKLALVERFKTDVALDTFALTRQIEARRMDSALLILNQLLKDGEKPEKIMGGLRYTWGKNKASSLETKRKLKSLLTCDLDIKTGKLRPDFALEKLVIKLCSLPKS